MSENLLDLMRLLNPEKVAADLLSVQPISEIDFGPFKSEKELVAAEYNPVDGETCLLWVRN